MTDHEYSSKKKAIIKTTITNMKLALGIIITYVLLSTCYVALCHANEFELSRTKQIINPAWEEVFEKYEPTKYDRGAIKDLWSEARYVHKHLIALYRWADETTTFDFVRAGLYQDFEKLMKQYTIADAYYLREIQRQYIPPFAFKSSCPDVRFALRVMDHYITKRIIEHLELDIPKHITVNK